MDVSAVTLTITSAAKVKIDTPSGPVYVMLPCDARGRTTLRIIAPRDWKITRHFRERTRTPAPPTSGPIQATRPVTLETPPAPKPAPANVLRGIDGTGGRS